MRPVSTGGEGSRRRDLPIVAIGASAGGLASLSRFFRALPKTAKPAFVVAQHLDPKQTSVLAELLQRATPLPVTEVRDSVQMAPGRVYVLAPGRAAMVEGTTLIVVAVAKPESHAAMDGLFRSLAASDGGANAGIVMSGTGSSGSTGLKAIAEAGGLALVESPESAEYDGMPRAAIATGVADHVAAVEYLPEILLNYFDAHPGRKSAARSQAARAIESRLPEIIQLLRDRARHDFSHYKLNTLARRVARRMAITHSREVQDYLDLIVKDGEEAKRLFRDFLISVTRFFRDASAHRALQRRVLAKLGGGEREPSRIWVPGTATGEEAYSLAILLHELLAAQDRPRKAIIFATDIAADAVEYGRIGHYPRSVAQDVSKARLRRYFVEDNSGYRVHADIREMCVFSVHNLVDDPPFSRLDLISCRNVLIYFNAELQQRIVPTFHYALKPGGHLMLGPSENVAQTHLFAPVDRKHRLFRRTDAPAENRPGVARGVGHHDARRPFGEPRRDAARAIDDIRIAERVYLDHYAPAFVIVNEDFDILHVNGRTGRFLELPPGQVRASILDMARPGLRLDLRAALRRAAGAKSEHVQPGVAISDDAGEHRVDIVVRPLNEIAPDGSLYLVVFQPSSAAPRTPASTKKSAARVDSDNVRQLEAELAEANERLKSAHEEHASSGEELKSANEELLSMNEELQSANEELDTSKEELQSVNEELQTVNVELNSKMQQLGDSHAHVNNLLQSTQIATLFLDTKLRLRYFTPAVTDIFSLIESDAGRSITHFANLLEYSGFEHDARSVLRTLVPVEREVDLRTRAKSFIVRLNPYRTAQNVIDGVVVSFLDITERKRTEAERGRLAAMVEASPDAILGMSPAGDIIAWNHGAESMFGHRPQDAVGRSAAGFIFEEDELLPILEDVAQERIVRDREMTGRRRRGAPIPLSVTASPAKSDLGKVTAVSIVARDITARKTMEERQLVLMRELNHRVKNSLATAQSMLRLSHRDGMEPRDFIKVFGDRLQSLAQCHELLSESNWRGASLKTIVEAQIAPYAKRTGGANNVSVKGRDIVVAPRLAESLALVFHELATNAAKHGAMSAPGGRVTVEWRAENNRNRPKLAIAWTERGGPRVDPPTVSGLGRTLIERELRHSVGAKVKLDFRPMGVEWHATLPMNQEVTLEDPAHEAEK